MRTITVITLCVGMALVFASPARAQSRRTFAPALSISAVHDDNLFLETSPVAGVRTVMRPAVAGSYESPGVTVQGLASFDAQVSSDQPALNALAARRQAIVGGHVRATPVALVGVTARYDRTDTPGDLSPETGILLERQNASRWQMTPSLSYQLAPRATMTAQYDWASEHLSGQPGGQGLHATRFGAEYQRSPVTSGSVTYVGRLFTDSLIDTRHSQAVLIGWSHGLGPGARVSLQVGPRVRSYGGIAPEVAAAFVRRTPRHSFLLDYWQSETIMLGVRGPVDVLGGTNRITWFLGRHVDIGANLGVYRSVTLARAQAVVVHGSLVGRWHLRDTYTVAVSYGADVQRGDIRSPLKAQARIQRGVLIARLTFAPGATRFAETPFDPDPREIPVRDVVP